MDHETLPPCPRADCDADREWAAHHWHWKSDGAADHTHRVCTNYCEFDTQECSRCYSAHVPNPSESPTGSPSQEVTRVTSANSPGQASEVTPDAERASAGRVALIRAALDSAPDALITLDADDVRWLLDRLDAVLAAVSDAARDIGNDTGSDVECYGDDYWRGMVMAASRILGDVRRAAEDVE